MRDPDIVGQCPLGQLREGRLVTRFTFARYPNSVFTQVQMQFVDALAIQGGDFKSFDAVSSASTN